METDLRRAASTTYYALFHRLARCCADAVVSRAGDEPSKTAWRRAYRALDHSLARRMCLHADIQRFPPEVRAMAERFVDLQDVRVSADYDPYGRLFKSDVEHLISGARDTIRAFNGVNRRDQRAFAAHLLFRPRG